MNEIPKDEIVYGKDGRKMNPNSLAAVAPHRIKPGQALNPNGRPTEPTKYFKKEIKRILAEVVNAKDKRTKLEALTERVVETILSTRNENLMVKGYEMLKDSIDGKPLQETAISGQGGMLAAGIILIPVQKQPENSPNLLPGGEIKPETTDNASETMNPEDDA